MGTNSRLVQCGEILLEKGHQILGVISAEPALQRWAKEKRLRIILPSADLTVELASEPFDYLFSIDNPHVINREIRCMAQRLAINFHDAPLPRYAGRNATNWAIMNEEKTHGVTWHVMTDRIDAGDILRTVTFAISDGETAFSLNTKCYEKSIGAFAELVDDLAEDRIVPLKQNLDKRTYYSCWRRPWAACTIDWRLPAEKIDALVRGLECGPYPNPIGLPKLYLADRVILVKGIEVLPTASTASPGTINPGTATAWLGRAEIRTGGRPR